MNGALIDNNVQIFFLVFARIFAMMELVPVISSSGANFTSRAGLSFFVSFVMTPFVIDTGYPLPNTGLEYTLLLFSEALIGLIMGFFLSIIFAIAGSAGQMFSLQMGFAATEAYDPMSGVEFPIMSQLLNLAVLMLFLSNSGMQKLFLMGVKGSFNVLNAGSMVLHSGELALFMVKGLALLFGQALLIAMPLVGSLFLLSVAMGLLSKADPQMNLMMVGFPIQLGLGFLVCIVALPNMLSAFDSLFNHSWTLLDSLMSIMRGSGGK